MIQLHKFQHIWKEAKHTLVVVKKKKDESDDGLIRRFKNKVLKSGLLYEAREDRHVKKSEERKLRKYRLKHKHELERKRSRN